MDPNKAYLPFDPWPDPAAVETRRKRVRHIERAVRRALRILNAPERHIVEGYYFDGRSLPQLANQQALPLPRVRTIHTRALGKLRQELTPFVIAMFGLQLTCARGCPICDAPWREIAEDLLDGKTADMTWGEVAVRIERAVGWRSPSPQILITHQRKHRQLQLSPGGTDV